MEERKIVLGDVFFVFTNFGLAKGRVIEIKEYVINEKDIIWESEKPEDDGDFSITQYKLNLINLGEPDITQNIKWGFWYSPDQLYYSAEEAIEAVKECWEDYYKFSPRDI